MNPDSQSPRVLGRSNATTYITVILPAAPTVFVLADDTTPLVLGIDIVLRWASDLIVTYFGCQCRCMLFTTW
jgi:hypothetical protein